MPLLKVLINKKGDVVGTARADAVASGTDAPMHANLVARADQRIVEVSVDDRMTRLDPAALHATLKAQYLSAEKRRSSKKKARR
jgi:hypothetical protein